MVLISKASLALFIAIASSGNSEVDATDNLRSESRHLAATYTTTSQYAYTMLARVNEQRAAMGLRALCMNTKLMTASKGHSNAMAVNNFMSHTGSDGSTMAARVTATGFKWTRIAENVAAGQATVDAVMAAWMKSSGHRANILGDYTMFGTAYAYSSSSTYGSYWTQNFGKSTSESCIYEDAEYNETPTQALNTSDYSSAELGALIPAFKATANLDCKASQ
ncbi:unnamed protein product [Phytophthora lilii]|uniref:Unnamed protein product n=1 Tax=Phytophthora lilii TaxID=2077276 RepID=A0A9W6TPA3_9STRA|nr:unnamed protein product [Phytophthora lilii]